MSEKVINEMEQFNWKEWVSFPDPRKGEYLNAPFGFGVYQLRNAKTLEYILFGSGKHLAERMSSLLPKPFGCGTRNNSLKSEHVFESLRDIEYRTVSFISEDEMRNCERKIKKLKLHKYNT